MMKRFSVGCAVSLSVLVAVGTPVVSEMTVAAGASAGTLDVCYRLSEPAVVTVAIATNRGDGVSVPVSGSAIRHLAGDANSAVPAGMAKFTWCSTKDGIRIASAAQDLKVTLTAWPTNSTPPYFAVDLGASPSRLNWYATAADVPFGVGDARYKTSVLLLRRIPAKDVVWKAGMSGGNSETVYSVKLTADYYIGVYPLTQGQYCRLTAGSNLTRKPAYFSSADDWEARPLENVSYSTFRGGLWPDGDATSGSSVDVIRKYTGVRFDMPTSAQWEFACRAGTGTALYSGVAYSVEELGRLGWNYGTAGVGSETHEVGLKEPNGWGLYDFYGNVDEFVLDCNGADYGDPTKVYENPVGAAPGNARIRRGGSWNGNGRCNSSAYFNTIDYPNNAYNFMGFRLACPVGVPQ